MDEEAAPSSPVRQPPQSLSSTLKRTTQRIKPLVIPYMAPLFLVYVSEYTINQVCLHKHILTTGRNTNPPLPIIRNALQIHPRRLPNIPNSLSTRCLHLPLLFRLHPNSQHLSPVHYPILHPLLPHLTILIRHNTFYLPTFLYYFFRGHFRWISLCKCLSRSPRSRTCNWRTRICSRRRFYLACLMLM